MVPLRSHPGEIYEEPAEIIDVIRTKPDTPRHCEIEPPTLSLMRKKVENHIKNTFLKRMQAPIGVKPVRKLGWNSIKPRYAVDATRSP